MNEINKDGMRVWRVEYNVNLMHEIFIKAASYDAACERFEEIYAEGLDVDEYDIEHEITAVNDQSMFGPLPEGTDVHE